MIETVIDPTPIKTTNDAFNPQFDQLWNEWVAEELKNYDIPRKKYLKKGYLHFDLRFWFPERKDEIKKIITNGLRVYNQSHKKYENWAFSPFLKIVIKTPRFKFQEDEGEFDLETKSRPISFSSHIDSLIFGFYGFVLGKKYEEYISDKKFDECVLAYRSDLGGNCNIQFSKEVFDHIKLKGNCTAIALDIKGYFNNIDHKILKEKWKTIDGGNLPDDQYRIYKSLTEYSYVRKNSILKTYDIKLKKLAKTPSTILELVPGGKTYEKFDRLRDDRLIVVNKDQNKSTHQPIGIPQGSAMSALLSNVYLIDFDDELYKKSQNEGFIYRRYCDDILIICDSDKAKKLEDFVIDKIQEDCCLEIQPKKAEIIEFRPNSKGKIRAFNKKKILQTDQTIDANNESRFYKSLQYLGFEYNGQDILIRNSSLSRYYRKMKSRIAKTVSMAYSKYGKGDKIWKQQLFHRYTHLGHRNFLSYAYNSSKEYYENARGVRKLGMNSPAIRKQLAKHFDVLVNSLISKNSNRYHWKRSKGKEVVFKK